MTNKLVDGLDVPLSHEEQADFDARLAAHDPNAHVAAGKSAVLTEFKALRDGVFARLNGIQLDNLDDAQMVAAIMACKTALKAIPQNQAVIDTVGGDATEDAVQALYIAAAYALAQASPYAYTAFRALDQ